MKVDPNTRSPVLHNTLPRRCLWRRPVPCRLSRRPPARDHTPSRELRDRANEWGCDLLGRRHGHAASPVGRRNGTNIARDCVELHGHRMLSGRRVRLEVHGAGQRRDRERGQQRGDPDRNVERATDGHHHGAASRRDLCRGYANSPRRAPAPTPEDGTLPPSAFTWEVVFHHHPDGDPHHHTHPFIDPVSGSRSLTFTIPNKPTRPRPTSITASTSRFTTSGCHPRGVQRHPAAHVPAHLRHEAGRPQAHARRPTDQHAHDHNKRRRDQAGDLGAPSPGSLGGQPTCSRRGPTVGRGATRSPRGPPTPPTPRRSYRPEAASAVLVVADPWFPRSGDHSGALCWPRRSLRCLSSTS